MEHVFEVWMEDAPGARRKSGKETLVRRKPSFEGKPIVSAGACNRERKLQFFVARTIKQQFGRSSSGSSKESQQNKQINRLSQHFEVAEKCTTGYHDSRHRNPHLQPGQPRS
ncbi:putative lipoprotein [Anopheles sinensis]|uniref:Putative lipoprotein n=1 Tax=Anopheles sinensis TaxID=74873 RepID=A0A084WQB1_ANOSI|nr:putative lipoprotein [Anopheles sinensis]